MTSSMTDEPLRNLVLATYPAIKAQFPSEGRRKWLLRALREYWANPAVSAVSSEPVLLSEGLPDGEDDPCDRFLETSEGVLVRTDYTNQAAWEAFSARLKRAEEEFADNNKESEPSTSGEAEMESDSSSEGAGQLLAIINPDDPVERAMFTDISNLTALRLLNDVAVRSAPPRQPDTKKISEPNPLIDFRGEQEVYSGVNIWIYDGSDHQSVRCVNQQGDVYGTATGDSWRAQVSHIYELQYNMTYLGMKIDFGGQDRYDWGERKRNLEEARL
ncbi:hypothetical protein C8J56DRAFT_1002545 [Mycena floridula]|nr:hypothetical protein C8J56DRAFT_1002545 [Mycena floridula]